MDDKLPGAWVGAVRLGGWPSAPCLNPRTACKLWQDPLPLYLGLLISEQFLPCVVAAGRIKWQKKHM